MLAELACFEQQCRARFPIDEAIYNCPVCGAGLLEVVFNEGRVDAESWQDIHGASAACPMRRSIRAASGAIANCFRSRRPSSPRRHAARGQHAAAGRAARGAIRRAGSPHVQASGLQSDRIVQRQRHDLRRRSGAPAGNEARGLRFHRQHFGLDGRLRERGRARSRSSSSRTATSLTASWRRRSEYGARTLQVEANFDQILALVRVLAERLGIYLLNSINPFRIEGQKSHHLRNDGPARLESAGLDRAAWRQSGQHVGLRQRRCANCTTSASSTSCRAWRWCRRKAPRRSTNIRAKAASIPQRAGTAKRSPRRSGSAIPVSWPKALHEVKPS